LFSKDFPTLKDRQISKMQVEFPKWLGEIKNSQTDGLGFHLSQAFGGHILALRNLDDPSKYLSSEFAIIAIEELTENQEDVFNRLRSRLRWTGVPDTKMIGATNPGGIGHDWVKKRWIERKFGPEELEADKFIYVKALPSDNPYLQESYMTVLRSLPENLRKAYLDGNWDVFEGQYFTEWDSTQHVIAPFELPPSWRKFRSIDPSGRSGITSCHWYALDTDGNVYVYREYYASDRDYDEHAKAIARLSQDKEGNMEDYAYTVMDTAAFAKAGYSETAVEIYERHGVHGIIQSAKERVIGWNAVHYYLRWTDMIKPKLRIFSTCHNLIRTLPMMQHDQLHPEDIDTTLEDHAMDELRYFLRTLREQKSPRTLSEVERRIEELKKVEQMADFRYARPDIQALDNEL
jgi:hypothetical protein